MRDVRSPMPTAPAREGVTVVLGSRVRMRDADGGHENTVVARVTVGARAGMRLRGISGEHDCARALANDEVEVHTLDGVRLLTIVAVVAAAASAGPPPGACWGGGEHAAAGLPVQDGLDATLCSG